MTTAHPQVATSPFGTAPGTAPLGTSTALRMRSAAGLVVAVLLAAISVYGVTGAAYARETASWRQQAIAQDWFDLVVAAPALAVISIWAVRGSRRAVLVLAGVLLYTLYTAVIYAFAVHLNPAFLAYCALLGTTLFALFGIGALVRGTRFAIGRRARDLAGGYLVLVGLGFAGLWLAQLVPAAATGLAPAELAAAGLVTNPVHVLDLSFILPLHVIAGLALWWRRPLGAVLAPVMLAFGALMAASIAYLALAAGGLVVGAAMAGLAVAATGLAVGVLRHQC